MGKNNAATIKVLALIPSSVIGLSRLYRQWYVGTNWKWNLFKYILYTFKDVLNFHDYALRHYRANIR